MQKSENLSLVANFVLLGCALLRKIVAAVFNFLYRNEPMDLLAIM